MVYRHLGPTVPYVFFLFVAIPILEIMLFIKVGSAIGMGVTIAIVIFTAILGSWLLRQQGLATLNSARSRLDSGQIPAGELVEGLLLLVGGVLLLTPGFFTDAVGFLCLFPYSRRYLAARLAARFKVSTMAAGVATGGSQPGPTPGGQPEFSPGRPNRSPGAKRDDVIEGEFREED